MEKIKNVFGKVAEFFAYHEDKNEVFVTIDGQCFFTATDAHNYGVKLHKGQPWVRFERNPESAAETLTALKSWITEDELASYEAMVDSMLNTKAAAKESELANKQEVVTETNTDDSVTPVEQVDTESDADVAGTESTKKQKGRK